MEQRRRSTSGALFMLFVMVRILTWSTQLDMSTSTKRSSHVATRTSTKRICTKQTYRSTVPTCRYAKQSLRTGPSTGQSPKAPSMTGNEQQRMFMRHTFCNQNGLCVCVGIVVLGGLVTSMGDG